MIQLFKTSRVTAFAVALSTLTATPSQARDSWIESIINADGSAVFSLAEGEHRTRLWTVSCTMAMRGCVARGRGLLLWVDDEHRPHLNTATAPGARVSIVWQNQVQDWPNLFVQSLSQDALSALSRRGATLVIEEGGSIAQLSPTEGMDVLTAYMVWLKSDTARLSRDARLWLRHGGEVDPRNLSMDALERFRAAEAQRYAGPRMLVPSTKPQAEFAIGAQDGASFFVERGL